MALALDVPEPGCAQGAAGFRSLVVAIDFESNGDRAPAVVRSLALLGRVPVELVTVSSPNLDEDTDTYELARRAATIRGAETTWTIVHHYDPVLGIVGPRVAAVIAPDGAESAQGTDFAALLASEGVATSLDVLHADGDPSAALLRLGERFSDPIYVATSVRWTDGKLHRHSTTRRLVQRSTRPVLVVPAGRFSS